MGTKDFMLDKILQLLRLSCPHKKMSHPFASASSTSQHATSQQATKSEWDSAPTVGAAGHYIVCLDCGKSDFVIHNPSAIAAAQVTEISTSDSMSAMRLPASGITRPT
jgi:hypothetical protein